MRLLIANLFAKGGALPFAILAQPCPYDPRCPDNPYGAGSPYRPDGSMNPYSEHGSPYRDKSWTNPFATAAPRLYDGRGNYRGRWSANPYDPVSQTRVAAMATPTRPTALEIPMGPATRLTPIPFMSCPPDKGTTTSEDRPEENA